jgi:heptosyltransferase-2
LLTHEKLAGLWQGHPSINGFVTFNDTEGLFAVARRLRSATFSASVVFPNSLRSALEVFLARVPIRIGYARNARSIFLTHPLPPRAGSLRMHKRSRAEIAKRIARNEKREVFPSSAHHVHDYLNLVGSTGADTSPLPPLLCVSDEEVNAARARFDLKGDLPLFALNPGAEYGAAKRWPTECFIESVVMLHQRTNCRWLILGGRGDRALGESVAVELRTRIPATNITNLAGETSLRELCAVLKSCALLVTNDTGPMHVAAAVGTPVVVPFGSTSPELTGPAFIFESPHQLIVGDAPCAPCFRRECPVDFRCMKNVTAATVVEAALQAWRGRDE